MCGISGIVYNKTPKTTQKFKSSAHLQSHRGPDAIGYYGDEVVDLLHHRLSILDLDARSNQPFQIKGKKNVLVYNGEIYNYKDLKEKYHIPTITTSDTEVLYHLVNDPNFEVDELNGIFAFAVYDAIQQQVHLYRDKLGVKPLYYYACEEYFIFASEAKVIYDYVEELPINFQALAEYLTFGHSNGNQTIVDGVKKLAPGHSLHFDIQSFSYTKKAYGSVEKWVNQQIKPTYQEAKAESFSLLNEAVERQCMSDVPVGAYLSGGIDSSAVVALASRHTQLTTYSVNFDKSDVSELKSAEKVAKTFHTNHCQFEVNTHTFDEILPKLVFQYDEPFADPAMIPLHYIAEKASLSSKVVLQGDGGDELFAGYGRHLDLNKYAQRKFFFSIVKYLSPTSKLRASYRQRYDRLNYSDQAELMASLVERDTDKRIENFFHNSFQPKFQATQPLKSYYESQEKFGRLPLMQRMLYTDMENILPHKYLEKVDKINMYHSIEARVPLLDNALVEYVMRLPQEYKIQKNTTKYLLRDMLKGLVPDDILNAKKRSFGTPIESWLTSSLYSYTIHQFELGKKMKFPIDYDYLIQELKKLKQGKKAELQGIICWKFLILTIWLSLYAHKIKGFTVEEQDEAPQ